VAKKINRGPDYYGTKISK